MRIGFTEIHRAPSPGLMAVMRRGMGQSGCPGSLSDALQSWLSSLSAESPADAAVGCGPSGGAPCGSPTEAAAMAGTIAQQFCDLASSVAGEFPGCTVDPACSNPAAAAASVQQAALQLFNSFEPSVWATEAANAASGQYYGPVGTEQGPASNPGCGPGGNGLYVTGQNVSAQCPNGTWTEGPNGMVWTYAPPAAGQALPVSLTVAPTVAQPTIYGPAVNVATGQPTTSAPAPAAAAPVTGAVQPSTTAAATTAGGGAAAGTQPSSTTQALGWFTESSLDGIPNWALVAAGVVALIVVLPMLTGGRR